jgi:hypothetical protein
MGIDRWTYLGPYAELPVKLKSVRVDQCPDKANCPNPTSGPFCAQCGIQVSKRFHQYQSADPPVPDFCFRKLGESLHLADGMSGPERIGDDQVVYRFIGNEPRPKQPREFHVDAQGDVWMDLSVISVQDELDWFKRAYAKEWLELQGTYGNLIFRWGFLQWHS